MLQNGAAFAAGEVGQAFSFDGSSGYVKMAASASLNVGAGAGLTFECWIKPAALADQQAVAEWNSGAAAGTGFPGTEKPVARANSGRQPPALDRKPCRCIRMIFHVN